LESEIPFFSKKLPEFSGTPGVLFFAMQTNLLSEVGQAVREFEELLWAVIRRYN
jgi:hypothetical protein